MQLKPTRAALAGILFALFGIGAAAAKDADLLSLGMEHFRDTATVTADPAEGVIISTENGYKEHRGPMRTVWNDEYLEGVIDQKTGRRSYRVYVWITYTGSPRSYTTVRYQSPGGPRSEAATSVRLEKSLCAVGDCTYTDHLTFPVEEDLLRRLAADQASGKRYLWPFKLVAKSGLDYSSGLSNAEIAGLLAKVDGYGNDVPAAAAAASNAAAVAGAAVTTIVAMQSLRKDFGVGGMPIAATADQTGRSGVLIIAVNGGSVAQKAGIIIGDIVYEFDGRPVKTPAELQAAISARAANTAAAIKLYRGTTVVGASAQF